MSKSRCLSLAYQTSGVAVAAVSLGLLLLPETRVHATYLFITAAILVHTVLGIYVDRLQGLTLKRLYDDFREGRRRPQSSWHTVLMILVLAAIFLTGPEVS